MAVAVQQDRRCAWHGWIVFEIQFFGRDGFPLGTSLAKH
jgi:hypothetical protein